MRLAADIRTVGNFQTVEVALRGQRCIRRDDRTRKIIFERDRSAVNAFRIARIVEVEVNAVVAAAVIALVKALLRLTVEKVNRTERELRKTGHIDVDQKAVVGIGTRKMNPQRMVGKIRLILFIPVYRHVGSLHLKDGHIVGLLCFKAKPVVIAHIGRQRIIVDRQAALLQNAVRSHRRKLTAVLSEAALQVGEIDEPLGRRVLRHNAAVLNLVIVDRVMSAVIGSPDIILLTDDQRIACITEFDDIAFEVCKLPNIVCERFVVVVVVGTNRTLAGVLIHLMLLSGVLSRDDIRMLMGIHPEIGEDNMAVTVHDALDGVDVRLLLIRVLRCAFGSHPAKRIT